MSEPFIGQIKMTGFNFPPRGWAMCDGQLLAISQNPALFSILGTTYGGDGRTTFALPDLRGRMVAGVGTGYALGQSSGAENSTLSLANLPAHNHAVSASMRASGGTADQTAAAGNMLAAGAVAYRANSPATDVDLDTAMIAVTQNSVGGGQAVTNIPPTTVINYVIALTGIFPSRN